MLFFVRVAHKKKPDPYVRERRGAGRVENDLGKLDRQVNYRLVSDRFRSPGLLNVQAKQGRVWWKAEWQLGLAELKAMIDLR
jgi:hypothetical protein